MCSALAPSYVLRRFLSPACIGLAAVTVVACVAAGANASSPELVAKRKQAAQVSAQISAIDERLSVVTERYDTARVTLETAQRRVKVERVDVARARRQYRIAAANAAKLLVQLYEQHPVSTIEAYLGATSLSQLLGTTEAEAAISRQNVHIAAATTIARRRVETRLKALDADRTAATEALGEISQERSQILRGLQQRQHLLASIQTQISQAEARERARQARLAAEARARVAAELKAEQAAAARRAAAAAAARIEQQQAQAAAKAKAAADAQESTTAATTTSATTTTPAAAGTTTPPPVPSLTPSLAPGETVPGTYGEAAQLALGFIGVPYLWGGATPSGFDCSGLVSYVFAELGVQLPHSAADQYAYGSAIARDALEPGDLVFFDNLDHVGIYIGDNEIVNAPHTGTFVRIDSLSESWYANRYVGARRL